VCKDGKTIWCEVSVKPVFKDGVFSGYIGTTRDITEKKILENDLKKYLEELKQKNRQLEDMAALDMLTGAYNRRKFEYFLNLEIEKKEKCGSPFSIIMFDIDNFKNINDYYGHRVGDEVISSLGSELNRIFRSTDIKGRVGGDEFMVLMKDIEGEGKEFIADKANAICKMFKDHKLDDNKWIDFSASIGIAFYDMDGGSYEELYEAADRALYNVKNDQKGTYAFCKETDIRTISRK
jgi:diguanylate cyclase (GGDEF)-like protein